MENPPSSDAALQLADAVRVRSVIESQADYRGHGIRRIWGGAVLACYFGAFLLWAMAPHGLGSSAPFGLVVVYAFWLALEEGARKRVRVGVPGRARGLGMLSFAVGIVSLFGILALDIGAGIRPLWAVPVVCIAVFLCELIPGLRIVRDAPAGSRQPLRGPLPVSLQIGTGVVAVMLGYIGWAVGAGVEALVFELVVFTPLALAALVQHGRWGPRAIGAVWAPAQWLGFASSGLLAAFVIVLAARAPAVQHAWALPLAVLTALPLATTAMLPGLDTDV